MKLKNLLIICMIFSFFMVAAVSPAVAEDFDAEVSMITDFNEAVNLMPGTMNVDATPDFVAGDASEDAKVWAGKAVVSATSRDVHVAVSGYGRSIKSSDITLEYYNETGGNLSLSAQIAPQGFSNASSSGCDFTLPTLYEEGDGSGTGWLNWIRVTVRDKDGDNPVYAWLKTEVITTDALDVGVFTPDVLAWDNNPLFICNSVNITLQNATDDVYMWWKDRDGTVRVQSEVLAKTTEFTISPAGLGWDPNFTISYNNSSNDPDELQLVDVSVDNIKGTFQSYFDDGNNLNLLTGFDPSSDTFGPGNEVYFLDVPECKDLSADTIIPGNVDVYYEGIPIGIDATDDVKIGKYNYIRLFLDDASLDAAAAVADGNLEKDWTNNNSQVVFEIDATDDGILGHYVAGPDDGVGPRLTGAAISYNDNRKVTLTFSEDVNAALINGDGVNDDIDIGLIVDYISITDASVSSTAANKIVVTTNRDVEQGKIVSLSDVTADTIEDSNENPAYKINPASGNQVVASVERIVDRVEVIGVDRTGLNTDGTFTGTTFINVYFDRSMAVGTDGDVTDDMAYFVEPKPGLPEDPNGTATVNSDSVTYTEVHPVDGPFFVTLPVNGVIVSTAAADLPAVKIIRDVKGGDPLAPLALEDRDVFIPSDDKVGPYLTSASFNLNPENGKIQTPADLLDAQKATLTLGFSEEVADEDLTNTSFFASGVLWDTTCLDDAYVSQVPSSTLVLTLDDDASTDDIPFGTGYKIEMLDMGDIEDGLENDASDDYAVDILDATPVWVKSSKIENNLTDIRITSVFGKAVTIDPDILNVDNNLITVAGDPNMVTAISKSGNDTLIVDVTSDQNTDWTPTVTIALTTETAIEDTLAAADYTANDLTENFSIVPDDKMPARITNADSANEVFGYTTLTENLGGGSYRYTIEVPFELSEPVNSDIWGQPNDAWKYFIANADYDVDSFVISGVNSCSGNRLTIKIISDVSIDTGINVQFDDDPKITDMNENESTLTATTYTLKTGQLTNVWSVPTDVQNDIPVGPTYMKIIGTVYDVSGIPWVVSGDDAVYAFSRQNLFRVDLSGDEVINVAYDVSHDNCFGAGIVQTDGSYHMNVYGGSTGFANGEPVILIFHDAGGQGDLICTTASLSNTEYSVAFQGGYIPVVKTQNLYLAEREEVTVNPGWNLISSSIATAYVDPVVCADSGLNPADFEGYIYGPDDSLTGAGSIPSDAYTMSSAGNRDSSALLFTISHPDLQNSIFAPYSAYSIADGLDDTLNNLPVFGPGLAFYVYLDDTLADAVSSWKIVLFGDKVPGPDYKVKVNSNQALVGHWGNLMYYTETGQGTASNLDAGTELPSTYSNGDFFYVDDISVGVGSNTAATLFAVTVTDSTGATVNVNTVSTYFNNTQITGPSVWWGSADLIDLGDLSVVSPGSGAWIEIDGAGTGSYFVNYMSRPVVD